MAVPAILVTGSSGHLGEALVRALRATAHEVVGLDLTASPFTGKVGTITDRDFVRRCLRGMDAVIHTATLHKPHVGTHSRQDFVDTNITGTLNLLEEAVSAGVSSFKAGDDPLSPLARAVGSKGYHDRQFADGPYPVS